eukprot:9353534-Alexandrium_andersonii.AAC.1
MSASLVGSEMCIRDRLHRGPWPPSPESACYRASLHRTERSAGRVAAPKEELAIKGRSRSALAKRGQRA